MELAFLALRKNFLSLGNLHRAFSLKRKASEKEAFAKQKLSLATCLSFPKRKKGQKGQVSIEFILILVFVIIYITTVISPLVNLANNSAEEVSRIGNAKIAAQKIADAVNSLSIAPSEAKTTIKIFLDHLSAVRCDKSNPAEPKITFEAAIVDKTANPKPCVSPETTNCCPTPAAATDPLICNGEVPVSTSNFTCNLDSGDETMFTNDNERKFQEIAVTKTASGSIRVDYVP